jgi:hypothetical protein
MKLIKLNSANLMAIASAMNCGVSHEELSEMIAQDLTTGRVRYFMQTDELWAFVDEAKIKALFDTTLMLLDA